MKIAFVVQRYGLEVNGGAELHCRLLAERVAARPEVSRVTVLTSCAKDYERWDNHYAPGVEQIGGIRVERFAVPFGRLSLVQEALAPWVMYLPHPSSAEWLWLLAQGPVLPGLVRRLRAVRHDYDAFVFFTYLYFPTVVGMHAVPRDKRVLVPTAHDEPPIRQRMYRRLFRAPRAIAFNTERERDMVRERFGLDGVYHDIVGCGVALAAPDTATPPRPRPYLLYVGRVAKNKGVAELAQAFIAFKQRHAGAIFEREDGTRYAGSELELVIAGSGELGLPVRPDILRVGFVADAHKRALMQGCEALAMPSRYESLSLVMLEAWTLGRAVLVEQACEVTRGHVEQCGGGWICHDVDGWCRGMSALLRDRHRRVEMGRAGRRYVAERYDWNRVVSRLLSLVARR